jgi:hypothetical protein
MTDNRVLLICSDEEIEQLKGLASSTSAGIWRIKRAKALLGALEGISPARLMHQVRVPVVSIAKCIQEFRHRRMAYFDKPERSPTVREAAVERMLAFLENPSSVTSEEWHTLSVRYTGMNFTARDLQTIRDMILSGPNVTRYRMAEMVCSHFHVHDNHGRPRRAIVSDILKRMEMDNLILLPKRNPASRGKMKTPPKVVGPSQEIHGVASRQAMSVSLVVVKKPEESTLWNGAIYYYHYIPGYRLFGRQLRYLVYVAKSQTALDDPCARILVAALSFSSSAWRVACRDDYIGWNDAQRIANLPLVVNNSRFLILPWVHVPNLASRILGAVARQVPSDWESRYGYRPVLLETFVERDRFHATCYKAANWIPVGNTVGYSLHGQKARKSQPARSVYLMPLHKRFRDALCQ